MNTRTTLLLAVVLVLLAAVYYVVTSEQGSEQADAIQPSRSAASVASRDVMDQDLGDIVKVVCQKRGGEQWVFEKNAAASGTGQADWRMTSPREMKCTSWEVTKFGSRLGSLNYEISYKPGTPGAVTAQQAGLDPPEAVITLTDADGNSVTVDIGARASNQETYVRLGGTDEICVGRSDLTDLVKESALDYRDKQLWNFNKDDVTRLEIVDLSDADLPVSYRLFKDGSRWMFESPVTAKATGKVDEMLAAMGRMRAIDWQFDNADKLPMYGLQPATLTVRATVEEEVQPDRAEEREPGAEGETERDDKPAPELRTKATVYELHISDRSPIGEDTKAYLRIGDDSAVATTWKAQTDKFKPVMAEWREMQITTVKVKDATRIDLTTADGSAILAKGDTGWSFEADGGQAEESAVAELLNAIGDLEAVAFVDAEAVDPVAYGFDGSQVDVRLTIPGVEGVERIVVGDHTDQATKRLVYVRRNDLVSIGKVRKADVAKLLRGPHLYRDRTVIEVLPSRYERIGLSVADNGASKAMELAFGKKDGTWQIVEPVVAEVQGEAMDKLVETLGGLRAEQVVTQTGEPSAYGLHAPTVTLALTYRPPTEYRIEDMGEDATGEVTAKPIKVQPPPRTITLQAAEHDGKIYAQRADRPVIFEMSRDFFDQLQVEYRSDRILEFDDTDVVRFAIRDGEAAHTFEKRDDKWVYAAEPDLPLDAQKVANLLAQLGDLRTPRYVEHAAADLSSYGLISPRREAKVTLTDGTEHVLSVSKQRGRQGSESGFYSAVEGRDGVFLLTPDSIKRFDVRLESLETE